ncbi:MAG: response regulator [Planctomycetota bacterium]|nr:response regulator [Planctomycetota bacterium]
MQRKERILVIEDEADILELMLYNLGREGYRVVGCQNGDEGVRRAKEDQPDVVLLDLMLPGLGGIEVCRRLKADPEARKIAVIMVTDKGEPDDVVAGLEAGADDYVAKPFSPKVLLARVRAVLRRREEVETKGPPGARVVRGDMVVDADRHEVRIAGEVVSLTATEFRLLHFLASHPGRVFTRNHLLDSAVGADAMVIDRNIDVHVGAIRKKLGAHREAIETVRGVGYRFRDL